MWPLKNFLSFFLSFPFYFDDEQGIHMHSEIFEENSYNLDPDLQINMH